jgi:hypothetical protein
MKDKGQYIHDAFEIMFFIVNIVVLPTAVITLWIARRSFEGTESARLATIYMEISSAWTSHRNVASRVYLLNLRDEFNDPNCVNSIKTNSTSPQNYIKNVLLALRQGDRLGHSRRTAILTYLEDLGVLCKKQYVREVDVFDLIASPIKVQVDLLVDYIGHFQTQNPSNYEHAILLFEHAKRYLEAKGA